MLPANVGDKYDIDPDFDIPLTPFSTPATVRIGAVFPAVMELVNRPIKGVSGRKRLMTSYDGEKIIFEITRPRVLKTPAPCVIYYHGGGFVMPANPPQKRLLEKMAENLQFILVSVFYRTALTSPFPVGLEDCYAALCWVFHNAHQLGVDPQRIAVYGDSSGGNFSTAVALLSRDRNGPTLCAQMMIYPVTDHRMQTESMKKYTDTPIWNRDANRKMWEYYLPDNPDIVSSYASPMTASSLKNLPRAYVETAEFDPLHDEGLNYAHRLQNEGIAVTIHETRRTVHAYDLIKEENPIVQESLQKRQAFLQSVFEIKGNSNSDSNSECSE